MRLFQETLKVELPTGPACADITPLLEELVHRSGVEAGILQANSVGSTGSITTIEFEPGAVKDLEEAVERLAPREAYYHHQEAWHDGNGHSHVQAALLGPSVALSIVAGRLALGTWQQVVVINHDNRARTRRVAVTIVGE